MTRPLSIRCAFTAIALLTPICVPAQELVSGLGAGEWAVLQAPPAAALEQHFHARVLHGETGRPVADAMVHLFEEDPGAQRLTVDLGRTGLDGCVRLRSRQGNRKAGKAIVSSPGFASHELDVGDLGSEEIYLMPARPLSGRVLDLDGRPVAGAIVRSRESCAHAPSAVQTRTDPSGQFRLVDFPHPVHTPDLEVFAEGHGGVVEYAGSLRMRAAIDGRVDLYIPRLLPVDLQVVTAAGEPFADRRVFNLGRPVVSAWTDEDGSCQLMPDEYGRMITLEYIEGDTRRPLRRLVAPQRGVVPIGPADVEVPPGDTAVVEIMLDHDEQDSVRGEPWVQILSSRGNEEYRGGAHEVSQGPVRIQIGPAFHGWREQVFDLDLGPGGETLNINAEKEPMLRVQLPEEAPYRLTVQADSDSRTFSRSQRLPRRQQDGSVLLFAPLRSHVVLLAWFPDGELRRAEVPRLTSDVVVHLDTQESIHRPAIDLGVRARSAVRIVPHDAEGNPVDARVVVHDIDWNTAPRAEGTHLYSLPHSLEYTASVSADGYCAVSITEVAPAAGETVEHRVRLVRRVQLTIQGNVVWVEGGAHDPEIVDGEARLSVAPGPLQLTVRRAADAALALGLDLVEGAKRTLVVR
jgi:hypothetical protein